MRATAFAALLLLLSCSEEPFSETPVPSLFCSGAVGTVPGGELVEMGTNTGGSFVPVANGQTFELSYSADIPAWSILVDLRLTSLNPSYPYGRSCAAISIDGEFLPGHLMIARDSSLVSEEPLAIALPGTLDSLLSSGSATFQLSVTSILPLDTFDPLQSGGSTSPVTVQLRNDEGLLAD